MDCSNIFRQFIRYSVGNRNQVTIPIIHSSDVC